MKSWTYRISEDDSGKIYIGRRNRGFSVFELIGFAKLLTNELDVIFKKMCDDKIVVHKLEYQKKNGTIEEIFLAK